MTAFRIASCSSGCLVGLDPLRTEVVRELCETVDFHGGRPWAVEVAVWDLVGKALGEPVWKLLGGRNERLLAYASTGERGRRRGARRALSSRSRERGVRAVKLRFHAEDWREDVARRASGSRSGRDRFEIMVDANQGWRMPGDLRRGGTSRPRCSARAALEQLGVYWLEEPLRTDDVDGYAALRAATGIRIAAGEMVRSAPGARDLVVRGGVDVVQADALFVRRDRRLPAHRGALPTSTVARGRRTPGRTALGLVANLHVALAFSTCPYVEVPYDPPAWSAERRDWLLAGPARDRRRRHDRASRRPGLGLDLDLDGARALARGLARRSGTHGYSSPGIRGKGSP